MALRRAALCLLLAVPAVAHTAPLLSCVYADRGTGESAEEHPDCARLANGKLVVEKPQFARMEFDRYGQATIRVEGQWYYLKRSGAALPVLAYDNGADYYAEGLARSQLGDHIAYYDRKFRQVIAPKYDWGWPFEHGRALVCIGCRAGAPDADGNRVILGGNWGYIDRHGREVVPVNLSREEALRRSAD